MKTVLTLLAATILTFAASNPDNIFEVLHQTNGVRILHHFPQESIEPVPNSYPHPKPRIIHGQEAEPHSIPYQAYIEFYGHFKFWACGGVLITPKFVLTAGRCTYYAEAAQIILGAHRVFDVEQSQQRLLAKNFTTHEYFIPGNIHFNIGLIEISGEAQINDYVRTIRIPNDNTNSFVGKIMRVSGWGLTDGPNGNFSEVLNFIEDRVISNDECNTMYPIIQDGELCMTGKNGKVICGGDVGGPATVDGVLVGVTIFSPNDCRSGYPTGYSRTSYYIDWIKEHSDYK